jgi:feruloyl esterase
MRIFKRVRTLGLVVALVAAGLPGPTPAATAASAQPVHTCKDLAAPGLFTDTTVKLTEPVDSAGVTNCRVVATIKPTPNSNIGVEYRLPTQWNAKFLGLGGGGFGGVISANAFNAPLQRGYAVAQTDIGHTTEDGVNWALSAPGEPNIDRIRDYSWRSWERMTIIGKQMVNFYYGQAPALSYWQGCSTGGREGFVMAQRYPDYYDAIIAGAPVYTNYLQVRGLWANTLAHTPGGTTLSEDKLQAITQYAVAKYDAVDGVEDGIIQNPLAIVDWDPAELAAVGLSPAEVQLMRQLYEGPRLADGTQIYPGRQPGPESQWTFASAYDPDGISPVMLRTMVLFDPNYDALHFNINTDLAAWDAALVAVEGNATNPDLREFVKRGGHLLMYHGWNDAGVAPQSTIEYFESVQQVVGGNDEIYGFDGRDPASRIRDNVRLFMVPGMNHCTGGVGPYSFDALTALERWHEQGSPPDRILARNNERGLERPLCPYPEVAYYDGSGDTNLAGSFECLS